MAKLVVFDVETQRGFRCLEDRSRLRELRVSVAVSLEVPSRIYRWYPEDRVTELISQLSQADLVVGFNLYGFDYPVLQRYTSVLLCSLPTLDLMEEVRRATGRRLSLNHLAEATVGIQKTGSGLQAIHWWRSGQIDQLVRYCQKDVEITWRVFAFGLRNGHVLYRDRFGRLRRVPVEWRKRVRELSGAG